MNALTRALCSALLLSVTCWGQQAESLPCAPRPAKEYSLRVGAGEKYSLTKSTWEISPNITMEYKVTHTVRLFVTYSQSFSQSSSGWAPSNSGVTVSTNWKLIDWGKTK